MPIDEALEIVEVDVAVAERRDKGDRDAGEFFSFGVHGRNYMREVRGGQANRVLQIRFIQSCFFHDSALCSGSERSVSMYRHYDGLLRIVGMLKNMMASLNAGPPPSASLQDPAD